MIRGPWTDRARRPHRPAAPDRPRARAVSTTPRYGSRRADGTESTREERAASAPRRSTPRRSRWSGRATPAARAGGSTAARGGLTTYRAMLDLRPDLFVHVGDTIYADEPMDGVGDAPTTARLWRQRPHRRGDHVSRDAGAVPRTAPLPAARRQRARASTPRCRRSCSGTTTRPATTGSRARSIDDDALHRAPRRRARDPGPAGVAGVPAGPGDAAGRRATATGSCRPGSTARSRAASTSTCSASTCAATAARTRPARRRAVAGQAGILGREQEEWLIGAADAAPPPPGR